jgi:putative ABC transport system permease protein
MTRRTCNKPPVLAEKLLNRLLPDGDWHTPLGDFEEEFREMCLKQGYRRAGRWYWRQVVSLMPSKILNSLYWRFVMLGNYFKTAVRNMMKSKGYTAINVFGLAAGIACCLLITLFVLDEISYDRFYPDADRIYRIAHYGVVNDRVDHTARSSPPLAKTLAEEFPEVEAIVKVRNYGFPVFRYRDAVFSEERVFSVDPSFFDVFQVAFIQGDPATALARPDAIVLTRSMVRKYFGSEDPVGKIINSDNRRDYLVTAVVEDVPANSHFHFDFLQSLERYDDSRNTIWVFNDFHTYVKLREGTDPVLLEKKLFGIVKERIDPFIRGVLGISADQFLKGGGDFRYYFQPLTDIHLRSNLNFELEPNGNFAYVVIFSTIALGILLIACINFINLSTARSTMRGREVGIRKTVGSTKAQIIRQFLTETVTLALIAMLFAGVFARLALPLFNQLAGKQIVLPFLTRWWGIPLFIGFALVIGILSGLYPAFFLASFHPVRVLRGDPSRRQGRSLLRTALVVLQFIISVILIIGTITIQRQMAFIQDRNLGFNKDQVVVIHKTDDLGTRLPAFKETLLRNPDIMSASNSRVLMGQPVEVAAFTPEGQSDDRAKLTCYMYVDHDFLDTYDIRLKDGRFFEKGRDTEQWRIVMNESAAQAMGLEKPVGSLLVNSLFPDQKFPVIGVVEDFHFQSLRQRIQPMVFLPFTGNDAGRYLSVRIRPEKTRNTMNHITSTWTAFAGAQPFEYEFFDDHFGRVYLVEERTGRIFLVFSILAVLIACLGLLGLSAFITERRTREIGIRKVLGSSVRGIVGLLIGRFCKWVLIANAIAWPVAYLAMNRWLGSFAYRSNLGWWVFILSAGLTLLISVITVGYQTLKAAFRNPVDSLRTE